MLLLLLENDKGIPCMAPSCLSNDWFVVGIVTMLSILARESLYFV